MFTWLTLGVLYEGTPTVVFGAGYYIRRRRFMDYCLS